MADLTSTLDLLPPLGPPPKKPWYALSATKAKPKADMTVIKKLMKVMQADGKSVTGVTIAHDGTITMTTAEAKKAGSVSSNAWDAELE